jgi:fluoroacetyl-CoA thioesterase
MDALGNLTIGMSAELKLVVMREMTIGHFVDGMPLVYATPMMILHMEMAAGSSIADALPQGFVSVGTEVNIRHLAATPIGCDVLAIARVTGIGARSVVFDVEAWNEVRKIGEGTHRRGIVNVPEFEKRFGVREGAFV